MPRSNVLRGLNDQRNRAQLRGRLDGRLDEPPTSPRQRLDSWLKEHAALVDETALGALDLTAFLRDTGHVDLPAEKRLTGLAIHADYQVSNSGFQGWLALDRIYQEASRLAPRDLWTHANRAVTAMECAEALASEEERTEHERRMLDIARTSLQQAEQISKERADQLSNDERADISYLLGSLCYQDPSRTADEALRHLETARLQDPGHSWAQLYRAHCLHDLKRWPEAAAAYAEVDAAEFVGPIAWRYELLLEQRAYCLLRAGDIDAGAGEFLRLLKRWKKAPELARELLGQYITEAATGRLRDQLLLSLTELVNGQGWDWLDGPDRSEPSSSRPSSG